MKMSKLCKKCGAEEFCKYHALQCETAQNYYDNPEVISAVADKLIDKGILK
jgi:hypothetical protein